jgi:predicted Zn-dependent protease
MKRVRIATAMIFVLGGAVTAHAQFGGVLNRAKDKINAAQQKAKPATDRAQKAVDTFTPWSAQEEQDIGAAGAAKMVAMFGLVNNPKVSRYVNLTGQAVSQFASRDLPYRFGVLDTDIVGAYALPGGYIFLTRAMLSGMTSEAQLAGALGHEVVHCAERHLEREIRSKKTSAWAAEEAKNSVKSSDLATLRADALIGDLFNTRLSRDKEDAADEQGTRMAAKAGYSAAGLMQLLEAMSRAGSKPENQRAFGQLLSTHPAFDDRIAHLKPIILSIDAGGKTLEARFRAAILQ